MGRRVVITGLGLVTALGAEPSQVLQGLKEGPSVFHRPDVDPSVTVAPVPTFDVREFCGRFKHLRYLNRGAQFAAAAALRAAAQADLTPDMCADAGLFVGAGPNLDIGGEFPEIQQGNPDREGLAALWMLRFLPNTAAAAIAKLCGVHGENATIGTACSASLQALGEAFRKIKDGYLDVAVAGGGDSRLSAGGLLAYKKAGALSLAFGPPDRVMRPFDEDRQGFVAGEGGAFLVLEEEAHAQTRGAKIWGEICGYGSALDGRTMTAPDPSGVRAETAVRKALTEADVSPSNVDAVSAHGTGTRLNDQMEAELIHRVFAPHGPSVTAFKSRIGHLAAACGAVETAFMLICMRAGFLPGIRNLDRPCRPDVNFIQENKDVRFQTALVQNFGFGGQNCAIVIKAPPTP